MPVLPMASVVHLIFDDGDEFIGVEGQLGTSKDGCACEPSNDGWTWGFDYAFGRGSDACVIRYRIRKPRALTMLQEIARDVPSREGIDA